MIPTSLTLLVFGLFAGAASSYMWRSCWGRENVVPKTPLTSAPPSFDPKVIKRSPPAKLSASSIDAFVRWVASTPVAEAQKVRDAIAVARADDEAARALIDSLFDLPVKDLGHHQLLLSIIGEVCRPEFSEPLVRFIGLSRDSIVREGDVGGDAAYGACTSYIDAADLLKARGVEMLAYLRTKEALESVLSFASNHDSRTVRLAALDAYIYNHDDSLEAIDRARAAAVAQDAKFVGVTRRTYDSDPEQFEASVTAFYEQYPEERPPEPQASIRNQHKGAPDQRSCS